VVLKTMMVSAAAAAAASSAGNILVVCVLLSVLLHFLPRLLFYQCSGIISVPFFNFA